MSTLRIFNASDAKEQESITDFDAIATRLHGIGVRFERWQANRELQDGVSNDEIIAAYRTSVDTLMEEYGFQSADVVALTPEHPDKKALREKFLDEHTHSDFEVRFFVDGSGLFYIRQNNTVYGVMCNRGDLISVPANTTHWFDMGANPRFKCIRLFTSPEGWVAQYTGDKIGSRFPAFEQFQ